MCPADLILTPRAHQSTLRQRQRMEIPKRNIAHPNALGSASTLTCLGEREGWKCRSPCSRMKNEAHLPKYLHEKRCPRPGRWQILQTPGKRAALTHSSELLEELSGGGNPSTCLGEHVPRLRRPPIAVRRDCEYEPRGCCARLSVIPPASAEACRAGLRGQAARICVFVVSPQVDEAIHAEGEAVKVSGGHAQHPNPGHSSHRNRV